MSLYDSLSAHNRILRPLSMGVLCFAFALGITSGCKTTSGGAGKGIVQLTKPLTIARGMTKEEIVNQLGEPRDVQHVSRDGAEAEIWTYRIERVDSSTIEFAGMQERTFIDHRTGLMAKTEEPTYRNEVLKSLITLELLFAGNEVAAFKETTVEPQHDPTVR